MSSFDDFCKKANGSIASSNNKNTRDVAMCQIVTGLTYSILALACAVRDRSSDSTNRQLEKSEKENIKMRKIANKALDDKNRLLDEKMKRIEAKEFLDN